MKSPAYYASLSREARLQRIGEILAKGVFLMEQARQAEARKEQQAQARGSHGAKIRPVRDALDFSKRCVCGSLIA